MLALAGCGDETISDPARADLPLTYYRQYGGVTGGMAEMRIERDGRATLSGGPPGGGCNPGARRFRLAGADLDRLRSLVAPLPGVEPKTREQPGVEGDPTIRIEAGGVKLNYVGLDVEPPEVRPLIEELERHVTNNCRRRTP